MKDAEGWCKRVLTVCVCLVCFSSAFTKMITVNGQEYSLQLVDTAGQVRTPSHVIYLLLFPFLSSVEQMRRVADLSQH